MRLGGPTTRGGGAGEGDGDGFGEGDGGAAGLIRGDGTVAGGCCGAIRRVGTTDGSTDGNADGDGDADGDGSAATPTGDGSGDRSGDGVWIALFSATEAPGPGRSAATAPQLNSSARTAAALSHASSLGRDRRLPSGTGKPDLSNGSAIRPWSPNTRSSPAPASSRSI